MKIRGLNHVLAFLSILMVASLACQFLTSTPTAAPEPTVSAPATEASSNNTDTGNSSSSGELITFTDKNKLYAIDLPGDWKHTDGTDTNTYWDTFTSPDKHAAVENVVYDDGTPWTGGQNGQGALYLLHHYYSYTGKEGDIRISEDAMQPDGSERLTWTSKGGNYSGQSFFEVRHKTTFMMFTVWWDNDYESTYSDVLGKVIQSYRQP